MLPSNKPESNTLKLSRINDSNFDISGIPLGKALEKSCIFL